MCITGGIDNSSSILLQPSRVFTVFSISTLGVGVSYIHCLFLIEGLTYPYYKVLTPLMLVHVGPWHALVLVS